MKEVQGPLLCSPFAQDVAGEREPKNCQEIRHGHIGSGQGGGGGGAAGFPGLKNKFGLFLIGWPRNLREFIK